MKRRRFRQVTSLQNRISEWAAGVREKANRMKPGLQRDELLKKLRQAEIAMHLDEWVNSSGPQPPK